MGIGIYKQAEPSSAISSDGDFTAPFAITFDGRIGGYKETKLYVRNDDSSLYFSDISLGLQDTTDLSITANTSNGFAWKLSAGDSKPTYNDWLNTPVSNSIELDDIGGPGSPDTSTYLPFWIFIQVPEGLDIQLFTDVKFVLTGNQGLV